MSDNKPNNAKRPKLEDSPHKHSWEVSKEEFENCNTTEFLKSPRFTININGEESEWHLRMYLRGKEDDEVHVTLFQDSKKMTYKVRYDSAIKTQDGYWPKDYLTPKDDDWNYYGHTKEDDKKVMAGWRYYLCTKEELEENFVEDKIILEAAIVIQDDKYRNQIEAKNQFVDNVRAISSQTNFTDFTIISGGRHFPCHRVLLAVRSEYFEALFRNESTKTELNVEEGPELVEIMLEFISKGRIPENIDDKAMDLILMADMYRLNILTMACETSLINNLSPDNAVETLIVMDKVNHVSKQENRLRVLDYINKEANDVVKSKDWEKFVQKYPKLITEVLLLKCSKNNGT